MPIYFIFIILVTIVAIFSEKIDEKINANGKLKRAVIIFLYFSSDINEYLN